MRQSVSPPIHQSIINQFTNLPICQSVSLASPQSANPPVRQSTNLPIRQSVSLAIHQSASTPISESANLPVRQSLLLLQRSSHQYNRQPYNHKSTQASLQDRSDCASVQAETHRHDSNALLFISLFFLRHDRSPLPGLAFVSPRLARFGRLHGSYLERIKEVT